MLAALEARESRFFLKESFEGFASVFYRLFRHVVGDSEKPTFARFRFVLREYASQIHVRNEFPAVFIVSAFRV